MKVIKVEGLPLYKVNVLFDDGVGGNIDLKELTQKGIFKVLNDEALFKKVYTTGYSIAWSDELEIDAVNIYSKLTAKNPQEILVAKSF